MTDQQPQQQATPVFNIEKIYVRDLSVEVPNAPQIFLEREQPQIDVQLRHESKKIDDAGVFETVLTVTVTAKSKDKTMFLVEAAEAGIFRIQNVPDDQIGMILGIGCPTTLFPYLRELINDVVLRAGFPPMLLNHVDFTSLYTQQMQQQPQRADAQQPTTH